MHKEYILLNGFRKAKKSFTDGFHVSLRLTLGVNRDELDVALRGMKNGKAVGPNGIPGEVWTCLE